MDWRLGCMLILKNNKLILLISIQKLFFGDDDAIYDVINEEPFWKWRHNYRHDFSRDPFAELSVFYTHSTIFIFRQIDRANIAVCGPTSLSVQKGRNYKKKKGIKITCGYAHLHIMSFITTKFYEILSSGFRGVALTNCVE